MDEAEDPALRVPGGTGEGEVDSLSIPHASSEPPSPARPDPDDREPEEDEDEDEAPVQVGLTDEQISAIVLALDEDDHAQVRELLSELGPADIAELLEKISGEERYSLLANHAQDFDPEIYANLEPELRRIVLSDMSARQVASILSDLDSDDALDLIITLEPEFQQEIIRNLSAKTRVALEEGLSFPEDSAGRLMQREFVAIPQFWTVGKTLDYLRAASDTLPEDFLDVFVITPTYHVVGEVRLDRLVRAQRSEKIDSLTGEEIHTIPATMDQEEVAHMFRREGLTSVPVVDEDERLIGVVTVDDVVDVIDEEAQEDFLKLGGVDQGDLYRAVFSTTSARFRWLFVNLLTAIFASSVVSLFDSTIEKVVSLAVLMPIVSGMGGNAGTQALTVAVRALATKELSRTNTARIIWKETLVGMLNGTAFAILMGTIAALWFHDPVLGCVIGAAMVINLIIAGTFGAGIPVLIHRLGGDPAVSSAVFLTTMTDVMGFFAFLGLATLFMI